MPPKATDMSRQDSGNPNEDTNVFKNAVASAQFTPSSKTSTMSPFGAIFTPSKPIAVPQNSNSSPSGNASSPHGSVMQFLNAGSTPDGPSTKSSSSSPLKPIGFGSSSPRKSSLVDGAPFSTDVDPNMAETRFVCFELIPEQWTENLGQGSMLEQAIHFSGLSQNFLSARLGYSDGLGSCSLYCSFDDLRMASQSKSMFEQVLTTVNFRFVGHHEYFEVDHANPRALAISAYDGQVEFVAEPKSMSNFNLQAIFEEVYAFAKTFGEVRSFAYIEAVRFEAPRFRAEYFSLNSAENAVGLWSGSDNVTIDSKPYQPAGYVRYTHPAAQDEMNQLQVATSDLDISGRGPRNNYGSRGYSGPRGRGSGRRAYGSQRGYYNNSRYDHLGQWWGLSADSIVHKTDMDFWEFNQPQTVNLKKIEAGVDVRTTIMLRNIPNRVQFEDIKEWLDETSMGHYDFSYLRIDFSNNQNVGYAFVNFVRPEFITHFVNERVGKPWKLFNSHKTCEVSYATIQGIDCLLAKFRNSVVMEEYSAFRPKLWYHIDSTDMPKGMMIGDEAPFPPPNNEQKRKRSRDNASTVGLFPPNHKKGFHGQVHSFRDGHYDRGNSFALAEERQHEEQRLVQYHQPTRGSYRGSQFSQRQIGGTRQNSVVPYQGPSRRGGGFHMNAPRRGGGFHMNAPRRNGGYQQQNHSFQEYEDENGDYFNEDDGFYHVNGRFSDRR